MMVFGMFVGQQFTDGADREDLDFFNFPEIDPAIGSDAIEAPIDGFMMRADPRNEVAPRSSSATWAPRPRRRSTSTPTAVVAASSQADTSGYTALQRKTVEFVAGARSIAQFLDRDTRPDFASTVMIPALQQVPGQPERRRRVGQQHREPDEDDLHVVMAVQPATAAPRQPGGPAPGRRLRATVGCAGSPAPTWSSSR